MRLVQDTDRHNSFVWTSRKPKCVIFALPNIDFLISLVINNESWVSGTTGHHGTSQDRNRNIAALTIVTKTKQLCTHRAPAIVCATKDRKRHIYFIVVIQSAENRSFHQTSLDSVDVHLTVKIRVLLAYKNYYLSVIIIIIYFICKIKLNCFLFCSQRDRFFPIRLVFFFNLRVTAVGSAERY